MTGFSTTVTAHAKVNLNLLVTGRRADGYHLLDMLNVCTVWGDRLELMIDTGSLIELEFTGPYSAIPASISSKDNLISKAIELFCRVTGRSLSVNVKTEKNIPAGGGLGGGSSNAAAVLRSLYGWYLKVNRLDSKEAAALHQRILKESLALGADVPFIYNGRAARVTGIGENISALSYVEWVEGRECLLILPEYRINTAAAFTLLRERPELALTDGGRFEAVAADDFPAGQNALELVACSLRPELRVLLEKLRQFEELIVQISGTGSSIYILHKSLKTLPKQLKPELYAVAGRHSAEVIETRLLANW
ncbi:MAG: hypothetical protein D6719_11725 [Candidatus Dadabacteria bacterium]|nr:MAG: hypothetical protein D6719_11725 [Candidatus Dadabacteria bacterium]